METGIVIKGIDGVKRVKWTPPEGCRPSQDDIGPLRCAAEVGDIIWQHNGVQWINRIGRPE